VTVAPPAKSNQSSSSKQRPSITANLAAVSASTTEEAASSVSAAKTVATPSATAPGSRKPPPNEVAPPPCQQTSDTVAGMVVEQLDLSTGKVLATHPSISLAHASLGFAKTSTGIDHVLYGRTTSWHGYFWRRAGSKELPSGLEPRHGEASMPDASKDATAKPTPSQRKSPATVAPTSTVTSNSNQSSNSKQRPSITANLAAASASTTETAASSVAAEKPAATSRATAPGSRKPPPNEVAPPPYQRTSDTVSLEMAKKNAKRTSASASSSSHNGTLPQISRESVPVRTWGSSTTGGNAATLPTSTSTVQTNSSNSKRRKGASDDSDMDISDDDENTGPNQSTRPRKGQEPPKKLPRIDKPPAKVMDTKTVAQNAQTFVDFPPDLRVSALYYSFAQKGRQGVGVFYRKHWPSDEMLMSAGKLFEMWEPYWQVEKVIVTGVTAKIEKLEWEDQSKKSLIKPLTVGAIDVPSLSGGEASKISWGTNKLDPERKPKDGDYALLLRMLPTQIDPKYKNKRANCHLWPKGTFLTVNGKPVFLQQRRQASHDESKWEYQSHPLDLAQYIKSPEGKTPLTMCCYDPTPFLYMVAVCCYKSPTSLTKGFLQPDNRLLQRLSLEESCEKAMVYINQQTVSIDDDDSGDDDETNGQASKPDVGKLVFSLLDPITKVPITTPVRGQQCKHWQVRM
jgi:hypothetical protein